ncbi:uncharacterized protein LOC107262761 [Cephus cinctus]|uniref:Uncharacterized protein LOC107262761 n=1 Tax=Cephus cinctus TaxID=211228 RepID=A0AAJ7FCB3_CEPCN|nr:uncharacterized protein LOC107262761 [Cephus cinctus]
MQVSSPILTEHPEINVLLHKPIHSTHRIKYTCFGVSPNYIILGSSSGSLYLFSREECIFQQLIPLSEGLICHVLISPDEKLVALATMGGSVCFVSLKPVVKQIALSTEHVGKCVTCLCWDDNSSALYIGDSTGKISVMVQSIFTVNGIFQVPASTLMNLDSKIIQMDFNSSLLLISTLTRSYLCDTVQEQYKQIGNKTRIGEFGACFYKIYNEHNADGFVKLQEQKNADPSRHINLKENLYVNEANDIRIYCARPGSRLWEVTKSGTVTKTHQFKEALVAPPNTIYKINDSEVMQIGETAEACNPQSVNFTRLLMFGWKYLFSWTSSGIYIIDPNNSSILLWSNELTDIIMADVIKDNIYLMLQSGEFRCLTLTTFDNLILQLYEKKCYNKCLQVCFLFKPDLFHSNLDSEFIEIYKKDNKCNILNSDEIALKLHSLITVLKSNVKKSPIKLNSGIVVVNSKQAIVDHEDCNSYSWFDVKMDVPSSSNEDLLHEVTDFSLNTKLCPNTMNFIESNAFVKNNVHENEEISKPDEILNLDPRNTISSRKIEQTNVQEDCISFLKTRTDNSKNEKTQIYLNEEIMRDVHIKLAPVYNIIKNIKSVLINSQIEEISLQLRNAIKEVTKSHGELGEMNECVYKVIHDVELQYNIAVLQSFSTEMSCINLTKGTLLEICKCFIDINAKNYKECICGFPCLMEKISQPKFLEVGTTLLKSLMSEDAEFCIKLCGKVPYLWRKYFSLCAKENSVSSDILLQCLQTKDSVILSFILPLLDTRQWKLVDVCLQKMEKKQCLFCDKVLDLIMDPNELMIDWNEVCREIVQREKVEVAFTLLVKVHSIFSNVIFNNSIYQALIFKKILERGGLQRSVYFDCDSIAKDRCEALSSKKVAAHLANMLEKDVDIPMDVEKLSTTTHHWGMKCKAKSLSCPCCTLSLKTPILLNNNGVALFPCGHGYHVNCLLQNKLFVCNLH